MTDSGLSTRLRQQSRRAGLMVGITMVLAIAICIFGAAGLFAWLSRPFSDLVPMVAPAAPVVPTPEATGPPVTQPTVAAAVSQVSAAPTPTPGPAPSAAGSAEAFRPTHEIRAGQSVNFRAGPSTSDAIIVALPPATPLQYLDQDAPTSNPNDGQRWLKFRIQNGQEGWIREIDTQTYRP
jgi:Bacterial SH3 domain